jgi:hypothetical protein
LNQLTDENAIRLKDYRQRPITWSKKNFKFDDPTAAESALHSPDEVWMYKDGDKYVRNYLKMYNDRAIRVQVNFDAQGEQIIKATYENKVDSFRRGILVN